MGGARLDAFAVYDEREPLVQGIVGEITLRAQTCAIGLRRFRVGWKEFEADRLREPRHVLICLGENALGPNHERLGVEAQKIGSPSFLC